MFVFVVFQNMAKHSTDTLASFLLFIHIFGDSLTCWHDQITEVPGEKCLVGNRTFVHDGLVDRHKCITDCMRRHQCQLINYNTDESQCVLSLEACTKLVPDERFNVVFVGPRLTAEQCLMWVSITEHNASRMVSSNDCEHSGVFPDTECYVGRLKSTPHIIPGKYIPKLGMNIYSVLNGSLYKTGIKEILQLSPLCLVTWVSYSAGNVLPHRAVVGGYWGNENDSCLYIIRGPALGKTVIGYYDSAAHVAYVEFRGANEVTDMEILVLV